LPGKHSTGQLGLPRYSFIAAAATLLVILVAWVAVRATGPSQEKAPVLVVPPSTPVVEAGAVLPSTPPPLSASPSASASPSPSPSRTRTPTASPSPSRTSAAPTRTPSPKPPVRTTSKPAAAASFSARYQGGAGWDRGFIAGVQVTNTGNAAGSWSVSISFDGRAGVRVTNVWNAQVSRSGDTWTFTGGPLAPDAEVSFGFQGTKQSRGGVRPTGCVVNGTACRMG